MAIKELEESYVPFQCMIVSDSNRFNVEGVSTAQYYILDTLNKQGTKTTKELAEMRGISQSGISKLTKRLLEKKYIIQERQTNDRRVYNIVLTKEGKTFLNRVEDFGNEIMSLIEEALTKEEVYAFSMMCKKITSLYAEVSPAHRKDSEIEKTRTKS